MYYMEIVMLLLHLFRFVCKQPTLACFYSRKIPALEIAAVVF